MKTSFHTLRIGLGLCLALLLPLAAFGSGSTSEPAGVPTNPAIEQANKAIKDKNWDRAAELLRNALPRDDRNAELYNLLGFVERNRGNLDAAFPYYEKALTLDPKHRGAHEYIGEAYLMADNLPKAEEHLAALKKICMFSCEEYTDLKEAISAYKQKNAK